jgi:acetyltransferase-like isoleucine patch superfamily enzyme
MISCRIGTGVYINFNCTLLDTCLITIGSRTLIGPNCSFYSATHPLDPFLRNGINGPELGKPITIGEDCWFGGNVIVLHGITIGRGVTVGAGSVVTKDVPPFHCVAGNPARIIRKIEVNEPDPLLTQQYSSEVPKGVEASGSEGTKLS